MPIQIASTEARAWLSNLNCVGAEQASWGKTGVLTDRRPPPTVSLSPPSLRPPASPSSLRPSPPQSSTSSSPSPGSQSSTFGRRGAGAAVLRLWLAGAAPPGRPADADSPPACRPCKAIAPVFEQLATKNPGVVFVKVDTDANSAVARRFNISAMPTFVFLRECVACLPPRRVVLLARAGRVSG